MTARGATLEVELRVALAELASQDAVPDKAKLVTVAILKAIERAGFVLLPKTHETDELEQQLLVKNIMARLPTWFGADALDEEAIAQSLLDDEDDLTPESETIHIEGYPCGEACCIELPVAGALRISSEGNVIVSKESFDADPTTFMALATQDRRVLVVGCNGKLSAAFGGSLAQSSIDPDLLTAIDRKLDAMLANPSGMWGSVESYELQAILLLELRFCPDEGSNEILSWFSRFVEPRHPDIGCRPLSTVTDSHLIIGRELKAFRNHLVNLHLGPLDG